MLCIGFTSVSFADVPNTRPTVIPQSQDPDACKQGYRGVEPCARWYYLTELQSPDAWQSSTENRESRWRWYGVNDVPVKPSKIIVLEGIHFDFDKYNLRPDAIPILKKNVAELKDASNVKIKIVGYTDSKGSDEYNQKLSERRANAVMNYFVSQGIDASRISAEGKGEADPVAPNTMADGKDNPEGRAKNRRIEVHIWKKK